MDSFGSRAELGLVPARAVLGPAAGPLLEGLVVAWVLLQLLQLLQMLLLATRQVLLAREVRLGQGRRAARARGAGKGNLGPHRLLVQQLRLVGQLVGGGVAREAHGQAVGRVQVERGCAWGDRRLGLAPAVVQRETLRAAQGCVQVLHLQHSSMGDRQCTTAASGRARASGCGASSMSHAFGHEPCIWALEVLHVGAACGCL